MEKDAQGVGTGTSGPCVLQSVTHLFADLRIIIPD